MTEPKTGKQMGISVVIPAKNEEGNVQPLVEEIVRALQNQFDYEIIYINDGSTDGTLQVINNLQKEIPQLKVWTHVKSAGQSRAVAHGVFFAQFPVIATLDADGQNDPADIPGMARVLSEAYYQTPGVQPDSVPHFSIYDAPGATALIAGNRTKRKDTALKRFSSKTANAIRSRILKDKTPDTGCGLKVFYRDLFLRLPFFDHMHRYLPALTQRAGYAIRVYEVNHRPRNTGTSKYGFHNRLWVGIVDMLGVMWLQRRHKPTQILENKAGNELDGIK